MASSERSLENLLARDATRSKETESGRIRILQEKLGKPAGLIDQGLLTKSQILEQRAPFTRSKPASIRAANRFRLESQDTRSQLRLAQYGTIRSARAGEVIEVQVEVGDFIQPGRVLARMESLSGERGALVFVPANEGKKSRPAWRSGSRRPP